MYYQNEELEFLENGLTGHEKLIQRILNEEKENGLPILFGFATKIRTFEYLDELGVSFLQVSEPDKENFLNYADYFIELPAYKWLAEKFLSLGAIDLADEQNFTALSGEIKAGELDRARILLDCGASLDTIAYVRRYGGSPLSIPEQAVLSSLDGPGPVAALELLQEYGCTVSPNEKEMLVETAKALNKVEVIKWLENNF